MHHISTLGMGHTKLAKETTRFRAFLSMKAKKVVPHHQLEDHGQEETRGNVVWVDTKKLI